MSHEFAGKLVEAATLGNFTLEENQDFKALWEQVLKEDRNWITRFYDRGTLLIIDDEGRRLVPKFNLVRKR